MAYESRIYVVDVHREKGKDNPNYGKVYYTERIAAFNLSCMGYSNGWRELFAETIDYDFYDESGDKKIHVDKYGARLTSADFETVIKWLEKRSENKEHYRRIAPVLAMLKGFDRPEWDDLRIIHYGCNGIYDIPQLEQLQYIIFSRIFQEKNWRRQKWKDN